jgi:tetratricopeptide (TPR) repeat protein
VLQGWNSPEQLEPRNATLQLQIAKILQAKGQYNRALQSYQRALFLKADLVEAQVAIGDIYMEKQDYLSAVVAYRQYTAAAPQNPEAYYKLGKALKNRDRNDDARTALEQAKRLYKDQGKQDGVRAVDLLLRELKQKKD